MKLFYTAVVAGVLITFASHSVAQQAYPTKAIRFIVPFPPGGSVNFFARLLGQKLSESWGQSVLVDNRPGGNTIIGSEALVKSAADGHTLILVTSSHAINPNLFPTPYDAIKDFAPVATTTSSGYILVLHPSVPSNTLREFIALAGSRPGQLNYASVGVGGSTHLASELFKAMTKTDLAHIPYKGSAPAMTDLLLGQVGLMWDSLTSSLPQARAGKLRALAVTGLLSLIRAAAALSAIRVDSDP